MQTPDIPSHTVPLTPYTMRPQRVTACAFAAPRPGAYDFATACDGEITLWTLDPYAGMLSQRKVTTGGLCWVVVGRLCGWFCSWAVGQLAAS